jgi:cell division transport system permease protein
LLYCLKEGNDGLRKARLAGLIAIVTVAISLILVGIFLIVTVNLSRLVESIRNRVELEVFIDDSLTESKIQELADKIRQIDGVEEITFISKEMAILEYKKLFEEQENDYFETLGFNPLPASFRIKLVRDYRTASGAEKIYQTLVNLDEINDQDIVYRREFLMKLEKNIKVATAVDILVGSIVFLSAILLVSNNIRLIILTKIKIIETMRLVGATALFIKMPLYIQGIAQGTVGGILAALFLFFLVKIAAIEIPGYISVNERTYILLTVLGAALGLGGSFTAIRRYLK